MDEQTSCTFRHEALTGRYAILKKLGHGSQGSMYLAEDVTGKQCAIKAYNLRSIPNWKVGDMMLREIEMMQTLNVEHVPHCYEIIDASTCAEPYYFIVQEYINGTSLLDLIYSGRRFTIRDIMSIMKDIVLVLDEINRSYHIIHRDVKPSNIMIDAQNHAWLVDFGSVVKCVKNEGGSTIAGTAGYMAPEQCFGEAVPESDIYGLGMTIIHLITGAEPFEFEQVNLRPKYHDRLPKNVPLWLVQILDRMIEPFAQKRARVHDVLSAVVSGNPNGELFDYEVEQEAENAKTALATNEIEPWYMKISPDVLFLVVSNLSLVVLILFFFGWDGIVDYLLLYGSLLAMGLIAWSSAQTGRRFKSWNILH